jgi:hypothetical protein
MCRREIRRIDQRNSKRNFRSRGAHPSIPREETTFCSCLPCLDAAGVLIGAGLTPEFPSEGKIFLPFVPKSLRQELPMGQVLVDGRINTATFARAVIRIAYCHAVAQFGLTGFRRLVTSQIILGRYPYVFHFVGGSEGNPTPPSPGGLMHFVRRSEIIYSD